MSPAEAFDLPTALTILAMAVATYLTRISGYWLVRRVAIVGRGKAALEAMPGSVLIALIAPMIFATGPAETLAAVVTLALAWRLPAIVAVVGGVASVVALRMLI